MEFTMRRLSDGNAPDRALGVRLRQRLGAVVKMDMHEDSL
jgi:hypothetical protein